MKAILLIALLVVAASAKVHFKESFDEGWEKRWVQSEHKTDYGKFISSHGKFYGDEKIDTGIKTSQDAKFYELSAAMPAEFSNKGEDLIISFTVKHEQKIDCGGGYIKLIPAGLNQKDFQGDSQYYIMFGPDICGPGTRKVHVILNYNGKNLDCKKTIRAEDDELSHVYTLIVHPDNTYEVEVDQKNVAKGSLYDDWPFLQPKEIPDPSAKKPEDWVDEKELPDPDDKKPADWDDIPAMIPDPDAKMPEDWDEELDGKWTAPMMDNPEYKGEWKQKMLPNPAYKGEWKAPMIANPEFVDDKEVYKFDKLKFVGFDLWQVKSGTIFDNIFVGNDKAELDEFVAQTWGKTHAAEKAAFDKAKEEERKKEEEERKKREEEEKAKLEEEEEEEEDEEEEADEEKDEL